MKTNTFDLGTDGLISEDPEVTEWMERRAHDENTP